MAGTHSSLGVSGLGCLKKQSSAVSISPSTIPMNSRQISSNAETIFGQYGNVEELAFEEMRYRVLLGSISREQLKRSWKIEDEEGGVFLRMGNGSYISDPAMHQMPKDSGLMAAIKDLKFQSAMTIKSPMVQAIVRGLHGNPNKPTQFPLGLLHLQIMRSYAELYMAQRHHHAAIVLDPGIILVWDSNADKLLERALDLEGRILETIWSRPDVNPDTESSIFTSGSESEPKCDRTRRLAMNNSLMVALSFVLMGAALGSNWKNLAIEIAVDEDFTRLAILVYTPIQIFFGLFFMQLVVICALQIIGPTIQCTSNSRFFSGQPPRRMHPEDGTLPHVTIQIPIYTEGLAVIEPTILSLKAAISTYEMQGGSANIFLNDDGLMLMEAEAAARRKEFYKIHDIGWVARPKHNPTPEGADGKDAFVRHGKFKKASNMNYGLILSNRVEEHLEKATRNDKWTAEDEKAIYSKCLKAALSEEGCQGQAEGNIRVGDYILLVDSDTRVPEDCLLDAVSELEESPNVAILQFSSSTLQIAHDYFENGIAYFTKLVYTAIRFMVANGDIAPFVGHNAVLRWSALQAISYECAIDHQTKYWSECRVSEDFDLSLRLQSAGYLICFASYTGDGFKEGVSLTVYDELARWEKYAYGASELIFNPLRYWFTRGPLTSTIMDFFKSNIGFASKATIVAYLGTYHAIGAAWLLLLANYFVIGLFAGTFDHWYLDSYKIFISLIVVFSLLSSISLAVLRYRLNERSLLGALWENVRHIIFLLLYFSGLSLHLSRALISHLLSIPMHWSTTAKEATNSNFFAELPKLKRFRGTFTFCLALTVMMWLMAWEGGPVPSEWLIRGGQGFTAVWPLAWMIGCHMTVPVVLNPKLMLLQW